jgi:hypothetical protein
VVLQLPAGHAAPVSEAAYTSLQALASSMHLVSPATLAGEATGMGFALLSSRVVALSSGKEFAVQVFAA